MSLKLVEWDPAKPWRVDISLVSKDLAGRYPKPGGQKDIDSITGSNTTVCVFVGDFTRWWMSGFSLGIFCRKSPDFHCCRSFPPKNKQTRRPTAGTGKIPNAWNLGEKLTKKIAPKLRLKMWIFGGCKFKFQLLLIIKFTPSIESDVCEFIFFFPNIVMVWTKEPQAGCLCIWFPACLCWISRLWIETMER